MYVIFAVLVIAGWLAAFFGLERMLKRHCAALRLEFQRQIDSLSAKVKDSEEAVVARTVAVAPAKMEAPAAPSAAQAQVSATPASDEITPETLATITETITALLGRKVRIRSVKILETRNPTTNPWAQHGRAVVQASHNLPQQRWEK
jgi:hypothetical protein